MSPTYGFSTSGPSSARQSMATAAGSSPPVRSSGADGCFSLAAMSGKWGAASSGPSATRHRQPVALSGPPCSRSATTWAWRGVAKPSLERVWQASSAMLGRRMSSRPRVMSSSTWARWGFAACGPKARKAASAERRTLKLYTFRLETILSAWRAAPSPRAASCSSTQQRRSNGRSSRSRLVANFSAVSIRGSIRSTWRSSM
mmetsp:Transcript_47848/g.135156  ORF Transcript_47848/g.135156 Transcript_47848/m.135156 type:complete len:201 (+) Transcript_47848:349-951(+)